MNKRVTIREVAEHAGVGTMTVSRVVNRSGYVNEQTRARVQASIELLGYMPNQHARSLRSRKSGTIALLVTDITNPFFTTVARGAEDAASEAGSLILFGNTDELEDEELQYMRLLVQKGVDGVLFVPARQGEVAIEVARSNGVPVVVLDRRTAFTDIDNVRCDSEAAGYDLGQLLLGLGHRRYTVLAGPEGISTSDDRVAGFLRGIGPDATATVYHDQFSVVGGERSMAKALEAPERATAVFAVNNFLAIGAQNEMRAAGIAVPEEIALVGVDDLPAKIITFPFLTVAAQPAYEMGYTAAKMLLDRIENPDQEAEQRVLPMSLIVRQSSGSPRN